MARDLFLSAAQHFLPVSCHRPGPFFGAFFRSFPRTVYFAGVLKTTFFDEARAMRVESSQSTIEHLWDGFLYILYPVYKAYVCNGSVTVKRLMMNVLLLRLLHSIHSHHFLLMNNNEERLAFFLFWPSSSQHAAYYYGDGE